MFKGLASQLLDLVLVREPENARDSAEVLAAVVTEGPVRGSVDISSDEAQNLRAAETPRRETHGPS